MNRSPRQQSSGWMGVILVAATFFYFLIFAQFAFLERLHRLGMGNFELKEVMTLMGVGGVFGSFLLPVLVGRWSLPTLLQIGFAATGVLAGLTLLHFGVVVFLVLAAGLGLALGWQTVAVVTGLAEWMGERGWGWKVGLGTGLAYGLCNVPVIFLSSPEWQTVAAMVASMIGWSCLTLRRNRTCSVGDHTSCSASLPTGHYVAMFAVLVWLDSSAFYIIQHNQTLQAGTWGESVHLWRNGLVHAGAALIAGWFLMRGRVMAVLLSALFILGMAGLLVNQPSTLDWGGVLYPAGVSLYSTALVACPAFLWGSLTMRERAWRAAWLYAIAGWAGSGLGIGMAENLQRVPWQFVLAAAVVCIWPWLLRWLFRHRAQVTGMALLSLGAWVGSHGISAARNVDAPAPESKILGHGVYLAEGCIHCHSQYVRPETEDEIMWGPTHSLESYLQGKPPLFGNRRQGPDLTNVGNRRSRAWLRQHFLDPRSVSPDSVMPSYAHLFEDGRGEALLDYMMSLGEGTAGTRFRTFNGWQPAQEALETPFDSAQAEQKYRQHCAVCHGAQGEGETRFTGVFLRPPTALRDGPWVYAPKGMSAPERLLRVARIIKFGLPGTDMPGHEWMQDSDVVSLARFVADWRPANKP